MKTFLQWLKIREAGAAVPYVGQSPGQGSWQGAAGGGKLSSVGDVLPLNKHHKKKKKLHEFTDAEKRDLKDRKDADELSQGPDYQAASGVPPYPLPMMSKKMRKKQ